MGGSEEAMKIEQVVSVYKTLNRKREKCITGAVIFQNDKFFTVDNGKYKESFLLIDIKLGEVKVVIQKAA